MGDLPQNGTSAVLEEAPKPSKRTQKRLARKRKKKLYKDILEQMEFYFSDANLRKDRFMADVVGKNEDGYVDLEVFLTFSKIKSYTSSVSDIATALSSSSTLQLNKDKSQVRRVAPVEEKSNVDDCTLYVERLPPTADHSWLKAVFSKHGTVVYVSLPRYKHNGKIKGFAFVEFSSPEDVGNVCRHFGYQDANRPEKDVEMQGEEQPQSRKRKLSEMQQDGDASSPCKMSRVCKEVSTTEAQSSEDLAKKVVTAEERKMAKKNRRRKKKPQQSSDAKEQHSLIVMPKCEWKRLRNKYLALQKQTMAQIKKSLLPTSDAYSSPRQLQSSADASPRPPPADSDVTVENKAEAKDGTRSHVAALEFQPNVIVKLSAEKPITNVAEFKNNIRHLTEVAYVDVMEGDSVAYVRCPDEESARRFVKTEEESFCGSLTLLTGDEEQEYWRKINQDREIRRSQKTRQKKRGVEKVMAKAQKLMEKKNQHIRFDDL